MKKSKSNKKKVVWRQYIGIVFTLLVAALCGIVIGLTLGDDFTTDMPFYQEIAILIGLLFVFYIGFFFHIIVHEAGHLLFGLMTGYKFSSFRIGTFMWMRIDGKLTLKKLNLAGTAGQCLMAPPDMKNGHIPFVLYNLGGSFNNAIFGFLFLICYLLVPNTPFLSPLLIIFATVGFISALMNGIPMRTIAVSNDGYDTLAMSRNKEAVGAFWVQLKVGELSSKGIRLQDMPDEWFAMPSDEAVKNSVVAALAVFVCNRLMDEKKFEEADSLMAHLLQIESGIAGLHRNLLICDRIYVELIGENRREIVQNMLTKEQMKFMKSMERFPSVLRTQYAISLFFDNEISKAQTVKTKFEKIAMTYPYSSDIESERELIQIAESKKAAQE